MRKSKPFQLPQAFLNQLGEFTNGFYLVTVNDKNEFQTFVHYPNSIIEMGLLNYVDMQSTALQEIIRQKAVDRATESDDETEST